MYDFPIVDGSPPNWLIQGDVTHYENRGSSGLIIRRLKRTPQKWSYPKEFEGVWRHIIAAKAEGAVAGGVQDVVFGVRDDTVEDAVLANKSLQFWKRELVRTILLILIRTTNRYGHNVP
jgi:hypothetical protein